MKDDKFNGDAHDLRRDEDDPLWRVLGFAPLPEPDGWFTARTVARCRHEVAEVEAAPGWMIRLTRAWRWVLGGGVAFSIALAGLVTEIRLEKADKQKKVQEAFEIVASMDPDPDSSATTSSWQD